VTLTVCLTLSHSLITDTVTLLKSLKPAQKRQSIYRPVEVTDVRRETSHTTGLGQGACTTVIVFLNQDVQVLSYVHTTRSEARRLSLTDCQAREGEDHNRYRLSQVTSAGCLVTAVDVVERFQLGVLCNSSPFWGRGRGPGAAAYQEAEGGRRGATPCHPRLTEGRSARKVVRPARRPDEE
jgi:hypothetical protein